MKPLLILFLVFYLLPGYSQKPKGRFPENSETFLIAKNSKRSRSYLNGDVLKIHYHAGNEVIKAKGRLFLLNKDSVQLIPYGKKRIVTISVSDISSVGRWSRSNKIASAVIGATGITAAALALAMETPQNPGVADGNLIGFGLVIYAAIVLWYEAIDIPVFILNEQISIRSEKRGYHFYIETGNINKVIHRRRYF